MENLRVIGAYNMNIYESCASSKKQRTKNQII